jgi:hypothetical protein
MAGVSPVQVSKVEKILSEASEEEVRRLRSGKTSINASHKTLKTQKEGIATVTKSITQKQIESLIKDIETKVSKISTAPKEIILSCKKQLTKAIAILTELIKKKGGKQ